MHPTARSNHTWREISVEGETRDSTPLLVVSAVVTYRSGDWWTLLSLPVVLGFKSK